MLIPFWTLSVWCRGKYLCLLIYLCQCYEYTAWKYILVCLKAGSSGHGYAYIDLSLLNFNASHMRTQYLFTYIPNMDIRWKCYLMKQYMPNCLAWWCFLDWTWYNWISPYFSFLSMMYSEAYLQPHCVFYLPLFISSPRCIIPLVVNFPSSSQAER